jgi:hypothetical protein
MGSKNIGIRFSPNAIKGFECYCDADFSGNWNKDNAADDPIIIIIIIVITLPQGLSAFW